MPPRRPDPPLSADPLYRDVPLDCRLELPVLGVAVSFETNCREILAVAEEAFGAWRVVASVPGLAATERVRVRLVLHEGHEGGERPVPLYVRMPDAERVLIGTPGSLALTDPSRREAVAYVTRELVQDRDHFRYGVLEALTLALVTRLDRQPLHAAALVRDGRGLLLAGPSGSGKSTLAYAAARAGYQVLAEDVVFLQQCPRLRVWGMPGFLHLSPEARAHFPELAGRRPVRLANGKLKIAVDLRASAAAAPLPLLEHARICLLARHRAATPTLARLPPEAVEREIASWGESGFDLFRDTIGAGVRQLACGGGWRLALGPEPRQAVALLQTIFDTIP